MNNAEDLGQDATPSLQSHLALGLHAFAQPLAILRAKLFLESVGRLDEEGLRHLAEDSAAQVERLCNLFNYLQEIVLAEGAEADLQVFPVSEAVETSIDAVDTWFEDSGFILTQTAEEADTKVLADPRKLSQAISSILLLAHGLSTSGETVEVATRSEAEGISVLITNASAEVGNLSAERRLALALIETTVRKQGGAFHFSTEPLRFHMRVPRAPITS